MLNLLPITVYSAIVLFVLKEIVEAIRRYRAERRKKKAISYLVADEIERNHWTVISLFRIFKEISKSLESSPNAKYELKTTHSGIDRFILTHPDGGWTGFTIPPVNDKQYKAHLPTIAELDKKLFKTLEETYSELAELEHLRASLIDWLVDDSEMKKMFFKDFIEYALSHEGDCVEALKVGYKKSTGKNLEGARIR
jgi:hypothetical protein